MFVMYIIMPSIYELFGHDKKKKSNRWIVPFTPPDPNIPEELVILTNLIDMTYNYTTNSGYHVEHFENLDNIRANTCGLIATHMFAEYLCNMKDISYEKALINIATMNENIEISDWYVGTAFANTTWRQAAVYRDRCTEGDWLKSFNELFNNKTAANVNALNKDFIQLRMCAQLILLFIDNKMKSLKLKKIDASTINRHGERLVHINDFPDVLQDFVEHLVKKHPVKQEGGQRKRFNKRM
jgi:hypothetical protein